MRQVWKALLPRMDVRTVLKYIPKLAHLGFLKESSGLTQIIVDILRDQRCFNWNKVLPAEISNVLNRYYSVPNRQSSDRDLRKNVKREIPDDYVYDDPPLGSWYQLVLEKRRRKCIEEKERKEQEAKNIEETKKKYGNKELMNEKKKQWEITERQKEADRREARKKPIKGRKKPEATEKEGKNEKKKKEPVPVQAPNKLIRTALKKALDLSVKVVSIPRQKTKDILFLANACLRIIHLSIIIQLINNYLIN